MIKSCYYFTKKKRFFKRNNKKQIIIIVLRKYQKNQNDKKKFKNNFKSNRKKKSDKDRKKNNNININVKIFKNPVNSNYKDDDKSPEYSKYLSNKNDIKKNIDYLIIIYNMKIVYRNDFVKFI